MCCCINWRHFIFLFFLIPSFVYGLNKKECVAIRHQIAVEWDHYLQFIEHFEKSVLDNQKLDCLKEALACCKRALSHCDIILKNIKGKPKRKRKEKWRILMKKTCKHDKSILESKIHQLEKSIHQLLSSIAFEKANAFYEKSLQKAQLAYALKSKASSYGLKDITKQVAMLDESVNLYLQARDFATTALNTLLATPHYDEKSKDILLKAIKDYDENIKKLKEEALNLPKRALAEKVALKKQVITFIEDSKLFEERGLKQISYKRYKQILPLLKTLIENSKNQEKEYFQKILEDLTNSIASLEKDIDRNKLVPATLDFSYLDTFKTKVTEEESFKKPYFNSKDFLKGMTSEDLSEFFVIPLNGLANKKGEYFVLFVEQFYHFLVQSIYPASSLSIQVSKKGKLLYEENIPLPFEDRVSWAHYLTDEERVFIPETRLKSDFGIDLHLKFFRDPAFPFSIIISQKGRCPDYELSFSLDGGKVLYHSLFSRPLPWQIKTLLKPTLLDLDQPVKEVSLDSRPSLEETSSKNIPHFLESSSFPILDQLTEALKKDPLQIAQYVAHEIAFVDPFLKQENGVFQAPGIHRNPLMTYLEKKGSPWEQCQLLVYLLRKAGYQASYVIGEPCFIPKLFAEKMFFTKLPKQQKEVLVQYPWVIFSDGQERVSLFPWMKEIQMTEGKDLYDYMPEEYVSSNRWILQYLKGDTNVVKHIIPGKDNTAAFLFSRFAEEILKKQGLSLTDVGIQRRQLKRPYASWQEFPHPKIQGMYQIFDSLESLSNIFAFAVIEISSHENQQKQLSYTLPLSYLNCSGIPIHFVSHEKDKHRLLIQFIGEEKEHFLDLNASDHFIDIKVSYSLPIGSEGFHTTQTLSMAKGESAVLCFHFGGVTPDKTKQFHERFTLEKKAHKKRHALLNFIGATYFEKCSYGEEMLANLHKINPRTVFAFGLVKLPSDFSKDSFKSQKEVGFPQIDMHWIHAALSSRSHLNEVWDQKMSSVYRQFKALTTLNAISKYPTLTQIFEDAYDD